MATCTTPYELSGVTNNVAVKPVICIYLVQWCVYLQFSGSYVLLKKNH